MSPRSSTAGPIRSPRCGGLRPPAIGVGDLGTCGTVAGSATWCSIAVLTMDASMPGPGQTGTAHGQTSRRSGVGHGQGL
jgi:hypothetical protein